MVVDGSDWYYCIPEENAEPKMQAKTFYYLRRSRQVLELWELFFLLWGGEQFDVNLWLSYVISFSHS